MIFTKAFEVKQFRDVFSKKTLR